MAGLRLPGADCLPLEAKRVADVDQAVTSHAKVIPERLQIRDGLAKDTAIVIHYIQLAKLVRLAISDASHHPSDGEGARGKWVVQLNSRRISLLLSHNRNTKSVRRTSRNRRRRSSGSRSRFRRGFRCVSRAEVNAAER